MKKVEVRNIFSKRNWVYGYLLNRPILKKLFPKEVILNNNENNFKQNIYDS